MFLRIINSRKWQILLEYYYITIIAKSLVFIWPILMKFHFFLKRALNLYGGLHFLYERNNIIGG